MPLPLFAILLALGGGASGCAARAPRAGVPVLMPESIGSFRLISRDTVRFAPADSIFRYADSTSSLRVSVFRYAIPADVRVGGDTTQWLEREGRKFEAIQPVLVQRGVLEGYEIAFAKLGSLRFGTDTMPEFATGVAVRMRGKRYADLQYLYVIDGRFLKIRATVPETSNRSEVPLFARELARRLGTR